MKHIITIALTLFLTAFAMAQERNYISTCGKTKTAIKWTEEHKDGKIYLHTVQGGEKHEYILGNGYKTESWKIVNTCLLYTSPSPRDRQKSRMPSSA